MCDDDKSQLPSKRQSVFRCCQACPSRLRRHTCITTLETRSGLWNAVFDRWTSGSSRDARHARVSHSQGVGPTCPEKEVEWSVQRSSGRLGETLPNVELEHAPCTRGPCSILVEAQLRSAPLWRTRGPQRGSVQTIPSFTSANWPATLLCSQAATFRRSRSLCLPSDSVRASAQGIRAATVSNTSPVHQAYQARKTSLGRRQPVLIPRLPCFAQTLAPMRKPTCMRKYVCA